MDKVVDRVKETTKPGTLRAIVRGEEKEFPMFITVVDTFYTDGSKDCTVKIPRIRMGAKTKLGG